MNLTRLMACKVCHLGLTENQNTGGVTFRHPVSDDSHDAQPVNAAHLQPVSNRCHTCTAAPPIWSYQTGTIAILAADSGTLMTYNDQWHVCYRCAQFIEADDDQALTTYSAKLMRWSPASDQFKILNTLHRGIIVGRQGRTLLTSTDWPAARIGPEMLPKIRDRFNGLLRGPDNLPAPMNGTQQRRHLAEQLDIAPLYWINSEFTDLVTAVSADQPRARWNDDLVPSTAGFLAWPTPVGRDQRLAAASWTPRDDGWEVIGYRSIGGALDDDLMPAFRHEIGWLVPIHIEHISRRAALDGNHPLGPLITTWLLIHQEMAEAVPASLPKGTTRAYQRNNRPAPDVRVVRIKPRTATTPSPRQQKPDRSRTRAKPNHRFWVSGHERQQAYGPGRSLRKPIDIQPFLKGDEGLPIKLSTTVRILGSRTAAQPSAPGPD